jgi:hypothetical protein
MADNETPKEETPKEESVNVEELKAELERYKGKTGEYERLLLDPSYLEFVAGRGDATPQAPVQRAQKEDVDFDSMTNKDLVEYLVNTFRGELRQNLAPVAQNQQLAEMQRQVAEAQDRYKDFWDYKIEMVKLARSNPALTADDAYHIAKGRAGDRPRKPSRSSEPPTGGASTRRNPPKGFESKFAEAWRASGLGSSKEE